MKHPMLGHRGRTLRNPHILFLTSYRFHIGGTERLVLELMRGLPAYRFTVVGPLSPQFIADVRRFGGHADSWKARAWLDPLAISRLFRLLRRHHPSILHVLDPRAGIHAWFCGRVLRIPILYNPPFPAYQYARSKWRRSIVFSGEKIFNHYGPDRIVFVSYHTYETAMASGFAPQERTRVIQNGVDHQRFQIVVDRPKYRKQWNTPDDAVVICFVGRLVQEKGVHILLDAVKALTRTHPKLYLWIVGDGPFRSELERRVKTFPDRLQVRFLGFREEIPKILRASDIFVLPSLLEAMPLTLLEAMAAGLPVIATSVGDNSYLIKTGCNGICITPGCQSELVEAIRMLLVNPERRAMMGAKALKTAEAYSFANTIRQYQEVYSEMLN